MPNSIVLFGAELKIIFSIKKPLILLPRVSVFTGPVLKEDDPIFVTEVDGESVQIPVLFWKLVYYVNHTEGKLCRAGFLVGQEELLRKDGIIHPKVKSRQIDLGSKDKEDNRFQDFVPG